MGGTGVKLRNVEYHLQEYHLHKGGLKTRSQAVARIADRTAKNCKVT